MLTPPLADISNNKADAPLLRAAIDELAAGRCRDPFALLGRHKDKRGDVVRVFYPDAQEVRLVVIRPKSAPAEKAMQRVDPRGVYAATLPRGYPYHLRVLWADGWQEVHDPYSFGTLIGDLDLHLFSEGRHHDLDRVLGAHLMEIDGVTGVRFAVWAPNALRVSVIGDFNIWDGRRHPMRLRHGAGIWELFIPDLVPGARYKYEIMAADGTVLPAKADPFAFAAEFPPATASVVAEPMTREWEDDVWMATRHEAQDLSAFISCYEVHTPSWRRPWDGRSYASWDELADGLIPYVLESGFSHIELLPVTEYPFSGSWGYQPLSLFAPTSRHGSPADFARFVDRCHQAGLGVIMDWVPAHFPADIHGLARFDGTHLYEHADPLEGYHQDWHTLIYNYGRNEVMNFLIASALFWLRQFHIDGLRVDAVASMLYRDYSRKPGQWKPNVYGGRENLEAVAFLRELSGVMRALHPSAMLIAEESTAWPGVTAAPETGGLGFRFKWNMGWMHDTLRFMSRDPLWRGFHMNDVTFGMIYAYSEHFLLPLSHDEVVHGKGSLLSRMPGDDWQRHANLRLCYAMMWAWPGKKLLFMGGEFAQHGEWRHEGELEWVRLSEPFGRGVFETVKALNQLGRALPALHAGDYSYDGFGWLIADDTTNCVFAWMRYAPDAAPVLIVLNMTPVPRTEYRIGVPHGGFWHEVLNTDAAIFGGSNLGNAGGVMADEGFGTHGLPCSVSLTLPPLAALYLSPAAPP
ncbi:1,4-alpha-glucan branching protein GlgB [Acidomonas methanolica]|uniref:1,4-alpha-glucan branching enzyme GlgB n=1 Tax=Acidomonas methanolica NBRC 104435 TaxID=1231351 RepID=A0A023D6L8_ACIMT|nr:1,4-alpha-glucan branching protein GlgB [Acidomonas methanolica]MBU2655611.1 1,4-alpha-glucan branching protein GlgB [Acidomonas methanolica]TCS21436.1 1,4-alpha-glucan branching enzyme [Acidomonas methanolica]GAJ29456.1 glycogen branching enzyme [Acidomonas methanolica NBRC 104435]GBQ57415.1 glycogen branching protein [Acidomonas methanolica]GEL00373.1 1,4-alpha-glucan branching enzyme GlgB 1 [Acidomonas methanolica NBRC 104435]